MPRILCLWFPNWPIQRLIHSRPELSGRPVVSASDGPRGGVVAACSSAAAAQGVRPGMPLAEAQALVRNLAVTPHDPAADRRALEKLAEACERFTPWVALEDAGEPECLLLDITNLDHLYGSEAALLKLIEAWFTRRRYHAKLGVADTVGGGWALAHSPGEPASAGGQEQIDSSPNLTEDCKIAIPGLPVEALRIPEETAALLRQLGIDTIGRLLSLPREGLASRFGDELLRRLDQFTGAVPEVVRPHRALEALEAAWSLEEPTADRAVITHVLGQLVQRLTRQLAKRDQGAVLLVCVLHSCGRRRAGGLDMSHGHDSGICEECVPLRIGLLEPSANARQILELIDLHLETITLAGEVDRVEVRVAVTGRLGPRQGELFAERSSADPHQLALLANRLSSRLGHERVLRAGVRASPVPERCVRYEPVTGKPRAKSRESRAGILALDSRLSALDSLPRPLLVHPQPQAIEVVCIAPDGPPQFVWLEGRRERIVHWAGPERVETLWWRGPSVRRDYYRVAAESGSHLWIFRRRPDARWFLHGVFA